MNRRDTIIIAVLVNSAILAVLFMLAINPEEDLLPESSSPIKSFEKSAKATAIIEEEKITFEEDVSPTDELDKALQDLAMNEPPSPVLIDDSFLKEESGNNESFPHVVEITVKRGDTLDKLSRANGTTIESIRKANQLKTDVLRIGQVLRVPVDTAANKQVAATTAPAKPAAAPSPSSKTNAPASPAGKAPAVAEPEYYIIKSGDNPWKIAKHFKVKFEDLLKLNNLDEEKARALKPGDKIRVR